MPLPWQQGAHKADYLELHSAPAPPYREPETQDHSYRPAVDRSFHSQDTLLTAQERVSTLLHGQPPSVAALGEPIAKRRLHALHLFAAVVSLLCLGIAIAAVANEQWSWRLGVKNRQLIILGFLLGIMNLCLTSVTPHAFILLEARFGPSNLQNYEGILRNQVLSSRLSLLWRLILASMLALPLGLSVAYKTFTGGESRLRVEPTDYIPDFASYYGMFAPPGIQGFGQGTGVSLFSNATVPFVFASTFQNGSGEPEFPTQVRAYGNNILQLNNESTAVLDLPFPSYVSGVQNLLALGESWNITARVYATVGTFQGSRSADPKKFDRDFLDTCQQASASSGAKEHMSLMNNFALNLIDRPSPGSMSLQYVAVAPDPGIDHIPTCSSLSAYAQPFNISRQQCQGTWSITRGGIELTTGSCDATILQSVPQKPITNNTVGLFPAVWYMSSLVEMLGPFATKRNNSKWEISYMATSMATMMWSRMTAVSGAIDLSDPVGIKNHTSMLAGVANASYGETTYSKAGLLYHVEDSVIYRRPTLRKSPWLYLVLASQPILTLIALGLSLVFQSTPVDKGFGLVSILSGINRDSLESLAGATLSGKLAKSVRLIMQPKHHESKNVIDYHIIPSGGGMIMHNGALDSKIKYH